MKKDTLARLDIILHDIRKNSVKFCCQCHRSYTDLFYKLDKTLRCIEKKQLDKYIIEHKTLIDSLFDVVCSHGLSNKFPLILFSLMKYSIPNWFLKSLVHAFYYNNDNIVKDCLRILKNHVEYNSINNIINYEYFNHDKGLLEIGRAHV